jgi:ferredoxin-thioredoxin reductase catalytic chain
MKKYWRCFVCNDIHYGVKPPETCPTCGAVHAFVEISPEEAHKVMGLKTEGRFSREEFVKAITVFAEPNEFRVTPDVEKLNTLLDGVMVNEQEHGLKYCPCRLATKDFAEDLKLICPCNFRIHETYKGLEKGECWCGLFVRRS